ncbi:MAG TPA: discoidin domain-containing protein [Thermoleophilaceae bacterium]|nr:discoidin domain-containing protein [Thermoleophilaceae bacterium]
MRTFACAVGVTFALIGAVPAVAAAATCPDGRDGSGWTLSTSTFDNHYTRHAFVGNGYLSQRVPPAGSGYMATGEKTGWPLYTPRYDGAFVAGLYGRDPSIVDADGVARTIDAAIPTWSTLNVTAGSDTYSATTPAARISNFRQQLFLGCGLLRTSLTWTAADGRATDLVYDVLADRAAQHVGVVHLTMTPHWDGRATVTDMIDGAGARRLQPTGSGRVSGNSSTTAVGFATQGLGTQGTVASTLMAPGGVNGVARSFSPSGQSLTATDALTFNVRSGQSYELAKYVGVDTALTTTDYRSSAIAASQAAAGQGWSKLYAAQAAAWGDLWDSDVVVNGQPDMQDWVRSQLYSLWSSIRAGSDNSISPTGLSSDNYAGLIFWDAETWMYPSLLLMHPDVADSVIEYRNKQMPEALQNAAELGYKGTLFPWNGAGTGDLAAECHSVDPPHCETQIHLQGDIALSVWQYYLATGDTGWLRAHWPILRGIAEFWASKAQPNSDGTWSIKNVAGPDEYSNGVNDGVFTNAGASLALRHATQAAQILGQTAPAQWSTIADNLRMPFDSANQVFSQYDGYHGTLIKQADTVLLIYPLEWPMSTQVAANTLDYYAERSDPDGPAMTDAMHAVDSAQIGAPGCATNTYLDRSIKPFIRDPFAQFAEARGDKAGSQDPLAGSPAYDFTTGSGGFTQVFLYGLTGFRWRADHVELDPMLPPQLSAGVTLTGLQWHGRSFDVRIGASTTTVTLRSGATMPVRVRGVDYSLGSGGSLTVPTRRPDLSPTDNLARCRSATATSEEAGMYAEAAVDGSEATIWAPDAATGSETVDLGSRVKVKTIAVHWTDTLPASSSIATSTDGSTWSTATTDSSGKLRNPVTARYVRVTLTPPSGQRAGIRELVVTG